VTKETLFGCSLCGAGVANGEAHHTQTHFAEIRRCSALHLGGTRDRILYGLLNAGSCHDAAQMLFQQRPYRLLDLSRILVQEILGGRRERGVVAGNFDLGDAIRFNGASLRRLGLGPRHLNGDDLATQDVRLFDQGQNECAFNIPFAFVIQTC